MEAIFQVHTKMYNMPRTALIDIKDYEQIGKLWLLDAFRKWNSENSFLFHQVWSLGEFISFLLLFIWNGNICQRLTKLLI